MLKPTGGWGYHSDTEILFPMRVAPQLAQLRGEAWQSLVARVLETPDSSPEQLAFGLLLIRLDGCLTCHTDCYRALRGCTACALTSVRRYRGEDSELVQMYEQALSEVTQYIETTAGTPSMEGIHE